MAGICLDRAECIPDLIETEQDLLKLAGADQRLSGDAACQGLDIGGPLSSACEVGRCSLCHVCRLLPPDDTPRGLARVGYSEGCCLYAAARPAGA